MARRGDAIASPGCFIGALMGAGHKAIVGSVAAALVIVSGRHL